MSFTHRIYRARDYLDRLEATMDAWIASEPCRVVDNHDPNTGKHTLYILLREQATPTWSLDIGECLFHMRSALDHLAFELAERYSGTPLSGTLARGSAFPISGATALSDESWKRKVGGVDPLAQEVLQGLQPHLRGNSYEKDPLWILNELRNVDTHRQLTLSVLSQHGVVVQLGAGVMTDSILGGRDPLHDRAEIGHFTILPDDEGNMNMQLAFPYFVSFGDTAPIVEGEPVIATLRMIYAHIVETIFAKLVRYT